MAHYPGFACVWLPFLQTDWEDCSQVHTFPAMSMPQRFFAKFSITLLRHLDLLPMPLGRYKSFKLGLFC